MKHLPCIKYIRFLIWTGESEWSCWYILILLHFKTELHCIKNIQFFIWTGESEWSCWYILILLHFETSTVSNKYMVSHMNWWNWMKIVREETCCHYMGYCFRLAARDRLYAPSHKQDNVYYSTHYGALAGTRNSINGSTMKDWSDNPLHHKQTLYHGATSCSYLYQTQKNTFIFLSVYFDYLAF